MAQYDVTYKCGHEDVVKLYGPYKDRERKMEWLATVSCPACKQAKREADHAKVDDEAAEAAKDQGLPELVGSPKQITWAETIRQTLIGQVLGLLPGEDHWAKIAQRSNETLAQRGREISGLVKERMLAMTDAGWWIERRNDAACHGAAYNALLVELAPELKTWNQDAAAAKAAK